MTSSKSLVGLADALEALRIEMASAIEGGRTSRMRFTLAPIELTVQVVVEKEANGKIGWKILEVGGSYGSTITQTLKLTLTPAWIGDDGAWTSSPLVGSAGGQGDSFGPAEDQTALPQGVEPR
jgi:hypothetical protein